MGIIISAMFGECLIGLVMPEGDLTNTKNAIKKVADKILGKYEPASEKSLTNLENHFNGKQS